MISENDLSEYYEMLEQKRKEYYRTHEPLLEAQIYHLQELIRIQAKLMGVRV